MATENTPRHTNSGGLISEEILMNVCRNRASQLNQLARDRGQTERTTCLELMDLYYKQRGRCDETGLALEYDGGLHTPMSMEVDHIVEINRRTSLLEAGSNEIGINGKCADIANLRWVCRFANKFKEYCRRSGLDRTSVVMSMAEQHSLGFPIRSNCANLGASGWKQFREQFLLEKVTQHPGISIPELRRMLEGTDGEASESVIRLHLAELGFSPKENKSWADRRLCVLREMADNNELCFDSQDDFVKTANNRLGHWRGFTNVQWRHDTKKAGIVITFRNHRNAGRRKLSAGDKAACLKVLRNAGDDGLSVESLSAACLDAGIPEDLVKECIDAVIEAGAAYTHCSAIVASLTRNEAAEIIGVSPNRLKKWGRTDWHDQFAGPPFVKQTEKGLTYYKRHEVEEFVRMRGSHRLDISVAGPRDGCVEGGRLGGRPASSAGNLGPGKTACELSPL